MYFIGHTLLGFSMKEVGRLTFKEWQEQYEQYKAWYNFKVSGMSYDQLEEAADREATGDELIPG